MQTQKENTTNVCDVDEHKKKDTLEMKGKKEARLTLDMLYTVLSHRVNAAEDEYIWIFQAVARLISILDYGDSAYC